MNRKVTQLYPSPTRDLHLKGVYLQENLRGEAEKLGRPFVFANFITSLDGRIAVPHPTKGGMVVPDNITNPRDWRLLQELQAQADLVLSTGRYLRDYEEGRAQENLQVYADSEYADLLDWRIQHGLKPEPDLAIVSRTLDFVIPKALRESERKLLVLTTEQAYSEKGKSIANESIKVVPCGEGSVAGSTLVEKLGEMGYTTVFSASGPKILHML
ncbi:MAG: dihydrofolate reductase family protein, partial [Chloroflexota bacterium]